jgi:D-3-phosphoglycerate dehydrogenase
MKIAMEQSYLPVVQERLAEHELVCFDNRTASREEVLAKAADADVMMFRWPLTFEVDAGFVAALPNLKLVHKSGSGFEHSKVVNLDALTSAGVMFTNNAGLNADVVAEHAMLLTLLALRPATLPFALQARDGVWDQTDPQGLPAARTLVGKTVGIVGLGQIGTAVAIRMRAFGVSRLLGYQRRPRFEHTAFAGVEWVGLDELLRESDVIVLCLPLSPATTGLIGAKQIELMKPDATLVNVGRGAVVDEAALFDALSSGRIRSAGLDVLTEEPSQSPLMSLPNVIVTPHTAGTAIEMQALQLSGSVDPVADYIRRRAPRRLLNPAVLKQPGLRAQWLASDI